MKIEKCKLQIVGHPECDKVVFTLFLSFIVYRVILSRSFTPDKTSVSGLDA